MAEKVVATEETPVIVPPVVPEPEAPKTMEQIQEEVVPEKETVGLDKFLELKKENKEFKKSIKDLEAKVAAGAPRAEVTADIESLSAEYPDVDKQFLAKLTNAIRTQVKKDADDEVSTRLKPLEEEARQKRIDTAFNTHFDAAMEKMPEFKSVVNKEVIKALSLDRKNASKNFSQIIEEAYGNAVPGKRTIETTTPGGGKEPAPLDFEKARKDGGYFNEVMADSKLKKEYNAEMLKRGF